MDRNDQKHTARPQESASTLDRWVLWGGIVLAVVALGVIGYSKWRGQPPQSQASMTDRGAPPIHQVAGNMMLTTGQRQFLDLADRAAREVPSDQAWLAAQGWLLGKKGAAAPNGAVGRAIGEAVLAQKLEQPVAQAAPAVPTGPGFQIRINGRSIDALVESINAITAALPDADARAFQKSVRILMVGNLPIEQMVSQGGSPAALTEEAMLGRSLTMLNGMNAQEVMKAAVALHDKLAHQQATQTGPFAPTPSDPSGKTLTNFAAGAPGVE